MSQPIFKDFRSFWLWAKSGDGMKRDEGVTEVTVPTAEEFERQFAEAMAKNYHVSDADDIDHAAFLVISGDGPVRYSIPMSAYLPSVLKKS